MNPKIFQMLSSLLLTVVVLAFAVLASVAQTKKAARSECNGKTTITDAAGRVHVRSNRISYAQRKAAAERRVKAIREASAKKKLTEVKK